jgi:hypothetical protein
LGDGDVLTTPHRKKLCYETDNKASYLDRFFDTTPTTGFWWGDLRGGDHLGDPGIDGRIILKWISKKWNRGMDWIELAQDRDRLRALMNAVMNFRVP